VRARIEGVKGYCYGLTTVPPPHRSTTPPNLTIISPLLSVDGLNLKPTLRGLVLRRDLISLLKDLAAKQRNKRPADAAGGSHVRVNDLDRVSNYGSTGNGNGNSGNSDNGNSGNGIGGNNNNAAADKAGAAFACSDGVAWTGSAAVSGVVVLASGEVVLDSRVPRNTEVDITAAMSPSPTTVRGDTLVSRVYHSFRYCIFAELGILRGTRACMPAFLMMRFTGLN
jgi:hypothetical protein